MDLYFQSIWLTSAFSKMSNNGSIKLIKRYDFEDYFNDFEDYFNDFGIPTI